MLAGFGHPVSGTHAGLSALMAWEVEAVRVLTPAQLAARLTHAGADLSVADLIRLNARHTAWHAGQIAALKPRTRMA